MLSRDEQEIFQNIREDIKRMEGKVIDNIVSEE